MDADHWDKLEAHEPHKDSNCVDDIWSGEALRKDVDLQSNRFLALGISTDGIPIFKSTKSTLWPVYLIIHNLPPQIRIKEKYIILCGLWQGPSKPDMEILLKPVVQYIETWREHGITVQTSSGCIKYYAKLVVGVFDAPAKCSVLCEKHYNGECGCSACLHPGKRLSNGARVYLPSKYPMRTYDKVIEDGEKALTTGEAVNGVTGVSPLSSSLNLVYSIPSEYMHSVVERVTRMMLNFWFDSMNHGKAYYLGRKVSDINAVLIKQRPPHEV